MSQPAATSLVIISCLLLCKSFALDCTTPLQFYPEECCSSVPQYYTKEILDDCGLNGYQECEPFNCVLKKKLLLNLDNKLDKVAIKKYVLRDQTGDWVPAIEAAYQTCITEADGDSCEARKFVGCFMHNIYKNCPTSSWINSNDCRTAKELFKTCKPQTTL